MDKKYADLGRKDYKGCKGYKDYHELLARPDIDAVLIATPDHWHTAVATEACKAKKDIYCEKPLTLTIGEAKRIIDVVRKYERVFQTGSQQRSEGPFKDVAEYIRNGKLGKIREVHVAIAGHTSKPCDLPGEQEPKGLLWDVWLGQAPPGPTTTSCAARSGIRTSIPSTPAGAITASSRGGYVTDWGAHHFDITQWALGMDESGPTEILPPETQGALYGAKFDLPQDPGRRQHRRHARRAVRRAEGQGQQRHPVHRREGQDLRQPRPGDHPAGRQPVQERHVRQRQGPPGSSPAGTTTRTGSTASRAARSRSATSRSAPAA